MNPPIKVLIVDDEETLRTHVAAYLEDEGFDVTTVADGEAALEVLKRKPADVGLIDIRLPGIDGDAVILQGREICPAMKFLIHTASASYTPPAALVSCGISHQDILVKPILDLDVLVAAIRRLADRSTA